MTDPLTVLAENTTIIMAVINAVGAVAILYYERRDPRGAVLWLLFLFVLSSFGLILYLLFGLSKHRIRRRFRTKEAKDRKELEGLGRLAALNASGTDLGAEPAGRTGLVRMLLTNGSRLTSGNRMDLINDGHEKFRLLFKDIEEARDHIHAEYYIVRNDDLGDRFLDLLVRKAQEGLAVRLLVDGVGTRLSRERRDELRTGGVEVLIFFPPVIERLPALNLRINHRNHRKIVVIDGRIGYLGGYNVGDEYIGKKQIGRWRDTHLRVEGPAVLDLQTRFLLDWAFTAARPLETDLRYFPMIDRPGDGAVQMVSGGPDRRRSLIEEAYLKMIASAQHSIYIQSPYFVPDESVIDALRVAALSGVDVRVMIPRLPDHPLVHWASLDYLGDLLPSGVRAFLFEDGFLHAKTIVVDGAVASIGSANWDIRSFRLNFETNAMVYCLNVARGQELAFHQDLMRCREWTLQDHLSRSTWLKMKCSFFRMFSWIL
ncbi:MAG: cardiolipin synthase [Methanomassiliicoccus sp.]|nr:cardiolipin synthase [Methanomassiliicoccus sp.]